MRRQTLSGALALAAVALLLSGTLGASSTTVDRSVSMAVVGDDDAYVGVVAADERFVVGERGTLVEIRNQFRDAVAIEDVAVGDDAVRVERAVDGDAVVYDGATARGQLGPGRSAAVEVTCTEPRERAPVTVTVAGSGSASFEVRDAVSVACVEPTPTNASTPTATQSAAGTSTATDTPTATATAQNARSTPTDTAPTPTAATPPSDDATSTPTRTATATGTRTGTAEAATAE